MKPDKSFSFSFSIFQDLIPQGVTVPAIPTTAPPATPPTLPVPLRKEEFLSSFVRFLLISISCLAICLLGGVSFLIFLFFFLFLEAKQEVHM